MFTNYYRNLDTNIFSRNIFLIFFFIVIFEGAIRKWFVPNSELFIVGFRDLIVLFCIHYAFKNKIFKFDNKFENLVLLWTFIVILWILIQLIFTKLSFQIALIGIRNWVLYLWLTLFFYKTLSENDLNFIFKTIIITIIPISILSVTQHFLPPEHFLNKQTNENVYLVLEGIVRTTGTFSFNSGYSYYLMFICPLIYVIFMGEIYKKFNSLFYLIIFLAFFLAVATSGSRLSISYSIVMIIPFLFCLFTKKDKKNQIILLIIISFVSVLIINKFFSKAFDTTLKRYELASKNVTMKQRVIESNFGTIEAWSNFSIIGDGIGKGSNPARIFLNSYERNFIFGETETIKILNEGGVLGIIFILGKFFLIYLLFKAYKLKKIYSYTLPFLYWCYLFLNFSLTSYTSQITSHAFSYLGLSIGLVLLKEKIFNPKLDNNKI